MNVSAREKAGDKVNRWKTQTYVETYLSEQSRTQHLFGTAICAVRSDVLLNVHFTLIPKDLVSYEMLLLIWRPENCPMFYFIHRKTQH